MQLSRLIATFGTTAYSTTHIGSFSLTTCVSSVAAFRVVQRGSDLCRRQQLAVRSKEFIRTTRNSDIHRFLYSKCDAANARNSIVKNTMAKKRKISSSSQAGVSTTATRRSTRSRALASKSESVDEEPTGIDGHKGESKNQTPPSSSQSYKMFMIISPAKTLNLEPQTDNLPVPWSEPLASLKDQRTEIVAAVKEHAKSAPKLGALLKTSASITATAQGYWKTMSADAAATSNTKPAIVTFNGAAYSGLNVGDTIVSKKSNLQYLQDHLRIVDPLYGWLRPMDAIEPYRLEMASKGVFSSDKKLKLEDYWKPGIEACLLKEEEDGKALSRAVLVVNLASDEYSAAVDKNRIMVKIIFKHGGRTIAVHAKRARGLMVRYATLKNIETVDGLKAFDAEGYSYQSEQSTFDDMGGAESLLKKGQTSGTKMKPKKKKMEHPTLVFDRPGTWKKPK